MSSIDVYHLNNKKITYLDVKSNHVSTNDSKYEFDNLIIATGSNVKRLPFKHDAENVFYLRNIEDSEKIKKFIKTKKQLVIIGGGYIGLEVASTAIKKGLAVTLLESEKRIMARSVCAETSEFIRTKHEENGVVFLFSKKIIDIKNKDNKKKIICEDDTEIECDFIVVGIGIEANTELANNAGLKCDDGIVVDENCKTSHDNIFAIGDCTNHPNNFYNRRLRLESVHNAAEQAKTAACYIIGDMNPYNQIPWFWSDQYDLKIKIIGISTGHESIVIRGSMESEKFAIFYLLNNRVIAVDAINYQKAFIAGKKIIHSRKVIEVDILKDESVNLKDSIF